MAADSLPGFIDRAALWWASRRGLVQAQAPLPVEQKGFALSVLDRAPMTGFGGSAWRFPNAPGDEDLMRGYAASPWMHLKFLTLSAAVAELDLQVGVLQPDGVFAPLPLDYPAWSLLRNPNPHLDEFDFRFLTELYVRLTGEAYWRLIRNRFNRPEQVWLLPRHWVEVRRDRQTQAPTEYLYSIPGAGRVAVAVQDMLWLRTPNPLNPYQQGLGDAMSLGTEVETFEYASEADRRFFLNDAVPPGAVVIPGQAPMPDEIKRIKDDWKQKFGGFWNTGEVPVLSGGADFKVFRSNRREMDFVEGQRYLREVILAGIHPHIAGISEGVNRANAEAADTTFGKLQVLPRAKWSERRYTQITQQFDRRAVVKLANPVPEDRQQKSLEARDANTGAILTRDERRAMLGQPALGRERGGDVFLMPLSLFEVPVGEATPTAVGERLPAQAAPTASPQAKTHGKQTDDPAAFLRRLLDALPDLDEETRLLYERLLPQYVTTMSTRWSEAARQVGLDVSFDIAQPEVERFLRDQAGQRIRGIEETTREKIREALADGIREGEDLNDLIRRVGDVFDEAKGSRAVVIARTEALESSNRAAFIAYGEAGVPMLEWLLAPDYDPAEDDGECEPFDGKIVAVGTEFAPGVQYPPLHPQCRCAIAPVFAGENGEKRYGYIDRKQHIAAIGQFHARAERLFQNAFKRAAQDEQNRTLRRLRAAGRAAA